MPVKQNVSNGVSTAKDTATEADVRYSKTFHAGKGVAAKIGAIPDCAVKKITPGTGNVMIQKGTYIADDIVVDGDPQLVSQNIRAGIELFGVTGDSNVVDTSGGNLETGSMLDGRMGYSHGKEVRGSIKTLTDASFSPSDATAYNYCKIIGSAYNSYVGAFDYSLVGYIAGKIRIHIANLLPANIRAGTRVGGIGGYIEGTYSGDATATAANILSGKTAGVKGSMVAGTMPSVGSSEAAKKVRAASSRVYYGMTNGAHVTNNTASGASGYPEVYAPYSDVASAVGLTAAKLAVGKTVLGISGSYKGLGNAIAAYVLSGKTFSTASLSNAVGTMVNVGEIDAAKSVVRSSGSLYARMTNGAHITNASSGYPEVQITDAQVRDAIGLIASKIKKGETVCGITGTWEGYVPGALDIYKRGAWGNGYAYSNLTAKPYSSAKSAPVISNQSAAVAISQTQSALGGFVINKGINLSAYKTINVVFSSTVYGLRYWLAVHSVNPGNLSSNRITSAWTDTSSANAEYTISLDISALTQDAYISFGCSSGGPNMDYVKQIWFTA